MPNRALPLRLAAAALLAAAGSSLGAAPRHVPAYQADFPDPFIVEHRGRYIAYSTNSGGINLPMLVSRDLTNWQVVIDPRRPGKRLDAMPALAPWVEEGRTWAPEVIRLGNRWLLYYTARNKARQTQCVGVAVAPSPYGPFRDSSKQPLVCQYGIGGTIDAHPFRDSDGRLYLYYKSDENSVRRPYTDIWGQRLSPDGLRVIGRPVPLVRNERESWEHHVVEAPTMLRTENGYVLLFSANHYGWESNERLSPYAIGYARCRTPLGPCSDAKENPILYSYNDPRAGCLSGPGHQVVFTARGRRYIAFHAWATRGDCRPAEPRERNMYIAPFSLERGSPVIGPSLRPVPTKGRR
jgi:beta-xylosidase